MYFETICWPTRSASFLPGPWRYAGAIWSALICVRACSKAPRIAGETVLIAAIFAIWALIVSGGFDEPPFSFSYLASC